LQFTVESSEAELESRIMSRPALDVFVIGAGPYGLAIAHYAQRRGLAVRVHGRTMEFWRRSMPTRMQLRSGPDWHLDACDELTFRGFCKEQGIAVDHEPIPVARFIEYGQWFAASAGLEPQPELIRDVWRTDDGFAAAIENGEEVRARAVIAAPGIRHFAVIPDWVTQLLPRDRYVHTSELTGYEQFAGQRCLVVGGRQSAYEGAALLIEAGAIAVEVVHRHPVPAFAASNWSFVDALVDQVSRDGGWFKSLPQQERRDIEQRFWAEGRLKLEPWLWPRIARPEVRSHPDREVTNCEVGATAVRVRLSGGELLDVDHVILATGYRANLEKVPYLHTLLPELASAEGFPVLDEHMQTSVGGLYLTGFIATRDYGPFFGFVRGCPAAAKIIVRGLTGQG
jgi:FAD-dependent urate hydroxylase